MATNDYVVHNTHSIARTYGITSVFFRSYELFTYLTFKRDITDVIGWQKVLRLYNRFDVDNNVGEIGFGVYWRDFRDTMGGRFVNGKIITKTWEETCNSDTLKAQQTRILKLQGQPPLVEMEF